MSLEHLMKHRRVFAEKPVLKEVYGVWFDRLIHDLPARARVLEAGAGPGLFAPHAKAARPDLRWVALDLIPARWNDVAGDAQKLPFRDGCFDAVIGLDFVHHLSTPLEFIRDVGRVLKPGGEFRVVEPWLSALSFPIYRFLHQEDASLGLDPNQPFQKGDSKKPFDGDAGVTRSLLSKVPPTTWARLGFADGISFTPVNAFAYLLSLGFKSMSLLPRFLVGPMTALDRALPFGFLAMRVDMRARKAIQQ